MKFKNLSNYVARRRHVEASAAFNADRRQFLRAGCACGALTLSSAGMALLASSGTVKAGSTNEVVKAGHLPAGCISHLLLAAQRGLFKEAGLAVDVTQFNGPMENLRALAVGGVDVAHNPWTASMADYAEGNDGLRIIGGSGIAGIELVAREGSVTSVEEFIEAAGQGLRVGTLRLDTLELVAYGTMSKNGLSYADYDMTFFNGMPGMGEALINGNVDVCTLAQPYAETVVKESGGTYIATSNDVWGPDAADCVINAMADFIEDRPEVATRYMEVLKEAGEQFHADFEAALDDLEPLFSASREVLEVALMRQPPAPVMSAETAAGIRQGVEYLIELDYFDSNIADEVIDLSLSPA